MNHYLKVKKEKNKILFCFFLKNAFLRALNQISICKQDKNEHIRLFK